MFAVYAKALCACALSSTLITNTALSLPCDTISKVWEGVSAETVYTPEHARLLHLLSCHGYSDSQLDLLMTQFSFEELEGLLNAPYDPLIPQLLVQPHFQQARMERYLAFAHDHPDRAVEKVVTQVNMDLDHRFYTDIQTIQDPDATDVLVNKYHSLGTSYVPKLVKMSSAYANGSSYMHPEAYRWFV